MKIIDMSRYAFYARDMSSNWWAAGLFELNVAAADLDQRLF
jgi:hypothetical protein